MSFMRKSILLLIFSAYTMGLMAQFEKSKSSPDEFENVNVKVGGDFALQIQGIEHEANIELVDLKKNVNLPTANLNITVDLAPGMQLYINNYMSSRHHNEAWVEGGYLTIDHLPFLPVADNIMKFLTIKAGVMNPNYGDAHFYRSNNAAVMNNPFVGNFIMDNFTTNPGMEIMFRHEGIQAMVGSNNGRLNFGRGGDLIDDLVFNWKVGYDKNLTDDLRVRATVSGYHVGEGHSGSTLWGGDRAGARYYTVMQAADATADNFTSGRWGPGSGQTEMTSFMINLFVQFYGLELFGIYEDMTGVSRGADQHFNQAAIQAIYRIGSFYLGTRFNSVDNNSGSTITRMNFGGGWNMVDNVLVKLDYVNQKYEGAAHGAIDGGKFSGLVLEAAISF